MFDYIELFLNLPGMTPYKLLTYLMLGFCRLAPIVALAPFFGAKLTPNSARVGIALFVSILLMPVIIATSDIANVDYKTGIGLLLIKEVIIGASLGFLISIPFYSVQAAGTLIDYQRGASQMMQQDPTLKLQASTLGITFNYLLIVIFFMLDGPFYFIDGIELSFEIFPVDGVIHRAFFTINAPFWVQVTKVMGYIFRMGIQLAAPSLVAILMAEMFLGIANRLAPQVQIAFLGMSLKSLLGLLLLWLGWTVILKQFGKESMLWLEGLEKMIQGMKPYIIS